MDEKKPKDEQQRGGNRRPKPPPTGEYLAAKQEEYVWEYLHSMAENIRYYNHRAEMETPTDEDGNPATLHPDQIDGHISLYTDAVHVYEHDRAETEGKLDQYRLTLRRWKKNGVYDGGTRLIYDNKPEGDRRDWYDD